MFPLISKTKEHQEMLTHLGTDEVMVGRMGILRFALIKDLNGVFFDIYI